MHRSLEAIPESLMNTRNKKNMGNWYDHYVTV